MSKIDELIAQYCPNGVEFKELREVCEIKTGQQVSKIEIQQNPGRFPVINSGREPLGFINRYNTENDPIGITTRGAGVGSITWCEGKYFRGNLNYSATIKNSKLLDVRFLYHILINSQISIQKLATFNGIPALNKSNLEKLTIPLPPLPVQQEIVNILDKFTELEAELEAELEPELEARHKQYEYYRNQLLTPVEVDGKWLMNGVKVEWKTLGEVCLKTENIKWKENQNIDYQYIDLSSVNRENNKITETKIINSTNAPSRAKQIVYKDDVIFGTTRPTLKRYTLITSKYHNQICSTGFCVLRANQKLLLPKFLFFILTTSSFYNYIDNNQEGAGYPSISDSIVKKFLIPIPPLAEQERIVGILEKFDSLVNDISIGLPAEIDGRRKQYEYYRGKLLNFKKVNE